MSTEENKAIARRFSQEVWVEGNLASLEELAAPNITVYYPYLKQPIHGLEAFKQALLGFHAYLSNHAQLSEDDIIAEGDKVVISWTASSTYTDVFEKHWGKPTMAGKRVVWTGISIFLIVAGKVVEEKGWEDERPHLRNLGLVPRKASAV